MSAPRARSQGRGDLLHVPSLPCSLGSFLGMVQSQPVLSAAHPLSPVAFILGQTRLSGFFLTESWVLRVLPCAKWLVTVRPDSQHAGLDKQSPVRGLLPFCHSSLEPCLDNRHRTDSPSFCLCGFSWLLLPVQFPEKSFCSLSGSSWTGGKGRLCVRPSKGTCWREVGEPAFEEKTTQLGPRGFRVFCMSLSGDEGRKGGMKATALGWEAGRLGGRPWRWEIAPLIQDVPVNRNCREELDNLLNPATLTFLLWVWTPRKHGIDHSFIYSYPAFLSLGYTYEPGSQGVCGPEGKNRQENNLIKGTLGEH